MKKVAIAMLLAALAVPAAAQEVRQPVPGPDVPSMEQMQKEHDAFKKAREEHRAQMTATQERMEKLVKEYNKLKDGKKKDAKRAEIAQEVSAIHEEQLKFKADQLDKFEARLEKMKAELAEENAADTRDAWVNEKTDALIEANGDLKALFGPRPGMRDGRPFARKGKMGKGPHKHHRPMMRPGEGPRGFDRPQPPAPQD